MSALTFDTLHYAKALKESGLSEAAAEKHTAALASVIHTIEKEVLLKSDQTISTTQQDSKLDKAVLTLENKIDNAEKRLENKIDSVEKRLENKIDNAEKRLEIKIERVSGELNLIKWMLGALIALSITNFARQYF